MDINAFLLGTQLSIFGYQAYCFYKVLKGTNTKFERMVSIFACLPVILLMMLMTLN